MTCHGFTGTDLSVGGSFQGLLAYLCHCTHLVMKSLMYFRMFGQQTVSFANNNIFSISTWALCSFSTIFGIAFSGTNAAVHLKSNPLALTSSSLYGQYGFSSFGTCFRSLGHPCLIKFSSILCISSSFLCNINNVSVCAVKYVYLIDFNFRISRLFE